MQNQTKGMYLNFWSSIIWLFFHRTQQDFVEDTGNVVWKVMFKTTLLYNLLLKLENLKPLSRRVLARFFSFEAVTRNYTFMFLKHCLIHTFPDILRQISFKSVKKWPTCEWKMTRKSRGFCILCSSFYTKNDNFVWKRLGVSYVQ